MWRSLYRRISRVKSKKSNLVGGLVGAFLGALIGCALWIVGYIAGIAGAVMGICGMKGYELLGGCLDKKGVIGTVIIMFAGIYFANTYKSIYEIIKASDLTFPYFGNLLMGYIFTILCSYKQIVEAFKESTGSYNINKVK